MPFLYNSLASFLPNLNGIIPSGLSPMSSFGSITQGLEQYGQSFEISSEFNITLEPQLEHLKTLFVFLNSLYSLLFFTSSSK